MSTGTIVAIIVVVVVVAAVIAAVAYSARRRRLQQRFGPEYDRAVEDSGSKRKAEAELSEREKRVKHLDIRPLDPAARESYAGQWTAIQEQFVDSPTDAVTGAQSLITSVMNDRGYPTDDAAQIMADLSVEHASTLEHFRDAQDLSSRAAGGTASTEELRQAMVHYRSLFQELLGDPVATGRADPDPAVVATDSTATPEPGSYASDAHATDYPLDTTPRGTVPDATTPDGTVRDETVRDGTMHDEPVHDEAVHDEAVRTDTRPADAVPAESVPADAAPAANGTAGAYTDLDDPQADEEDETSPAAAGRLFRRR